MVKRFLLSLRKKGGVVNEVIARSVAKTLVKHRGKPELMFIDLGGKWWIQSLFLRMGLVRRAAMKVVPRRKRSFFICTQLSHPLKNTRYLRY